jgi:membrane protein
MRGNISDPIILMFNALLVIIWLFYYERKKNSVKLRNPNFNNIENVLKKYYLGYFLRSSEIKYYPKLKVVYTEMIKQLYKEGIYPECLESYITQPKSKSFSILTAITVISSFLGVIQSSSIVSSIEQLQKELGLNIQTIFIDIGIQICKHYLLILVLSIIVLSIICSMVFMIIGFKDNVVKFSFEKQSKHIIEDLLVFYKNNELILEIIKDEDIIFTEDNIRLLNIRIQKSKYRYVFDIPKRLFSSSNKKNRFDKRIQFENNLNTIEIPLKNLDDQTYIFVFKKQIDGSSIVLSDVKDSNDNHISDIDFNKLFKIFEILILQAEFEFNNQNILDKLTDKIFQPRIADALNLKTILKYIIIILGMLIFIFAAGLSAIIILDKWMFYSFLFLYFCWIISLYIAKKIFRVV